MFLLLHTQIGDGLRKILNSEQSPWPAHRRDADSRELRIENVFAVAWGIHPSGVNDLRIRTGSDVLCDRGEAGTGFREAISEAGLARELVLKPIQIEHEQRVVAGGFEERVVPLKRGEALRGAFVVEGLEELALRVVHLELRARVRGNKKKK